MQILEKPCVFCQTPITGKGSVCTPCALGQKSNGESDHGPSYQIPQFQLALGWIDYNTSCQNPHQIISSLWKNLFENTNTKVPYRYYLSKQNDHISHIG